jgi:hypothetical protein
MASAGEAHIGFVAANHNRQRHPHPTTASVAAGPAREPHTSAQECGIPIFRSRISAPSGRRGGDTQL